MPATATPTTLSDLRTDLLNRARENSSTSALQTMATRYLNQANHDLHIQQNWGWSERRATLLTHPTYTTGSISIADATRTTVAGTNTAWATAVTGMGFNNARAGGKLRAGSEDEVYTVSSVGSGTAITLESRYVGSIGTASTYALAYSDYTYYEDEYALESDFFRLVDTRSFDLNQTIRVLSRQDFYDRYPRNSRTGSPRACTIIELGPSGSTADRPRVVFFPAPDAGYAIPYRYITRNLAVSSAGVGAPNLSADDDEPIIPLRYRHMLVFYALAQWYRDRKDDARAAEANAEYVDLVKRVANDSEPQRDHPRLQTRRAVYLAGVAGRRFTRGRYSADSRFDELRDG